MDVMAKNKPRFIKVLVLFFSLESIWRPRSRFLNELSEAEQIACLG